MFEPWARSPISGFWTSPASWRAPWATPNPGRSGRRGDQIEKPGEGDETRHFGPPFVTARDGTRGDATYFLTANRNKKSVTIDFSRPAGAALVKRLARRAHVVVENFKTGSLAKYGLDYASLAADNRRSSIVR